MSVAATRTRPTPRAASSTIVRGALAGLAPAGLAGLALAAMLGLVATGSAAAHGGSHAASTPHGSSPALVAPHGGSPAMVAAPGWRGEVKLRDCWLSAALVPAPAETLQDAFRSPLVLTQTFYGPDPLVGIWGLACDRARVEDRRISGVILSLVGVPTGLTAEGATPLANNFAHALLRADTNSRALAKELRRAGLPGRFVSDARYRHSSPQAVPSTGELVVPGKYRIDVSASELDPTNPHDHVNTFNSVGRNGRLATMGMFIEDAFDRFCFPGRGGCGVFVRAHHRSPVRDLLGDGSAVARGGFDHAAIEHLELALD